MSALARSEDVDAERQLVVGQLNVPPAASVLAAFDGIFDREFYTNHGPLVAEFEARLSRYLGVKHVICVTNGTVGLMIAAKALQASGPAGGDVIVPAFTFPATVQALSFAGFKPVFCDVDLNTHNVTAATVAAAVTKDTVGIVPVHMWGRGCEVEALAAFAAGIGAWMFFDAAHAFGCTYGGRRIGGFGSCEVFSFHATKILNCTEGGCITTDDDAMAAALRTIRNFHEQETFAEVPLRINGKMSEAQAAMGLIDLDDIDTHIEANRTRYERYKRALSDIRGLHFVDYAAAERTNRQFVVLRIDAAEFGMSRDQLYAQLKDRNIVTRRYFYPGMHQAYPYTGSGADLPATNALCDSVLQLPSGDMIAEQDIDRVCEAVRTVCGQPASAAAANLG